MAKNNDATFLPIQYLLNLICDDSKKTIAVSVDDSDSIETLGSGRKTVAAAGTAEALAASTTCSGVIITAETDNTGIIVVGDSGVVASLATREGTPLAAGDSIILSIDNLSKVYVDSTVNGDGVTYTYFS